MAGEPIQDRRTVSVSRVIAAEPSAIFAVLVDPSQHSLIDGSGTVRQARDDQETLDMGSKFSMGMRMGVPYVIKNEVVRVRARPAHRLAAHRHAIAGATASNPWRVAPG